MGEHHPSSILLMSPPSHKRPSSSNLNRGLGIPRVGGRLAQASGQRGMGEHPPPDPPPSVLI
eukprot:974446-Pyramimonas_sp.AAC.1